MLYIDQKIMETQHVDWAQILVCISEAVKCIGNNDYSQPVKSYLRYGNPQNRIIAMPAYLGGKVNMAGIKWIAGFPDNIHKGIPRAHSVTVLNDADTGQPLCVIDSAKTSIVRTAAVSGLMLNEYLRGKSDCSVAIIGFGPIGQSHYAMCKELFDSQIVEYKVFDLSYRHIKIPEDQKLTVYASWQEAYQNADVVITCTVSDKRYIDLAPKLGALLLNVSLRDYTLDVYDAVAHGLVVDDWEEVCRENTDVEYFQKKRGLQCSDVHTIYDVIADEKRELFASGNTIMFNPMGMAIFDIATASHFYTILKTDLS